MHVHEVPRPFDFDQYLQRPIALELFYLGKDYQGYARQDHTTNTIEVSGLHQRVSASCLVLVCPWQVLISLFMGA